MSAQYLNILHFIAILTESPRSHRCYRLEETKKRVTTATEHNKKSDTMKLNGGAFLLLTHYTRCWWPRVQIANAHDDDVCASHLHHLLYVVRTVVVDREEDDDDEGSKVKGHMHVVCR